MLRFLVFFLSFFCVQVFAKDVGICSSITEPRVHSINDLVIALFGRPSGEKVAQSLEALAKEVEKQVEARTSSFGMLSLARERQKARGDIQIASTLSGRSATTAVSDAASPETFGMSMERGALTRTTDGSLVTFSVNPSGLICESAVKSESALSTTDCKGFWGRFAGAFTFDKDRGDLPGELHLTALESQFAGFSVHGDIINHRSSNKSKAFEAAVKRMKAALARTRSERPWVEVLKTRLRVLISNIRREGGASVNGAGASVTNTDYVCSELTDWANQEIERRWRETEERAEAEIADRSKSNAFLHSLAVTAQYSFERPNFVTEAIDGVVEAGTRPPSLHTAELVVARGVENHNIDFTFDGSVSWFSKVLPGMDGLWRDARIGGKARFTSKKIPQLGYLNLSLSGLWMHIHQRPLGFEIAVPSETEGAPQDLFNQPGNIGLFHAKLEIPIGEGTTTVPLSFTYSNRTELIKESEARFQIGFTLKLDGLFGDTAQAVKFR